MGWLDELNTALDLYNEGHYEECAAHINVVFQDTTPGYPRTRYYALLASCADDWHEAEVGRQFKRCWINTDLSHREAHSVFCLFRFSVD